MKQSKSIPRRVGTSLVRSLGHYANLIDTAYKNTFESNSRYTCLGDHLETNKKYFLDSDRVMYENITSFVSKLEELCDRGVVPVGSFISIAKHNENRVRYVVTPSSVGLVITSTTLKRILDLATNVVYNTEWNDGNKRQEPLYICDAYSYGRVQMPHFLRLMDVLRFLDETDADMLEISVDGMEKDEDTYDRVFKTYGRSTDEDVCNYSPLLFPMLSDRYQEDSWVHYLNTLYSGLVTLCDATLLTPIKRNVALSEIKIHEQE